MGRGPYFTVTLAPRPPLQELLSHLYVLVPVLDDEKHYWVGLDEVEKLFAEGEGWLGDHPAAGADRAALPRTGSRA